VTPSQFNSFCKSLPHSTHVVQWGGADVWKIGGKVFAIHFPKSDAYSGITFKTSPMSFEMLKGQEGLRPAPYLASRGMKWIQWTGPQSLDAKALKLYLAASYKLVFEGLPRRLRAELVQS
jgi:predicted DNA-binding protein (MmcQ/YjbR family)